MYLSYSSRQKNRKPQLGIELLEDRCLLSTYLPGPLVLISHPDPLGGIPGILGTDVAAEPYVAVNPTNPNNIAAIWMDQYPNANAVSATLDGGTTWQNVAIPGFTTLTGGTSQSAFDPWLSFDTHGNLYSSGGAGSPKANARFLVNKSTDGGQSWSSPIRVNTAGNSGNGWGPQGDDKPSITADPNNPNYVYMTWTRFNQATSFKGQSAETMFARSADGGQTWQTEQSIHTAPQSDFDWGHQIVVLPNGTLIDAFTEGRFENNHQGKLTLLRSSDHGETWSAPISALVQQPLVDVQVDPPNAHITDPDTGQAVEAHPMFPSIAVDRTSGNLYAAWIDARFSNFQYNSIALSMSSDGGFTWSTPIQVNQTPNTVASINRQAFNPTIAVAADGTVGVSYYDFRNNTAAPGALTDYWLATAPAPATNPGNWSEVRLTSSSFDLEQAPTRFNGDFWLGDYEGLSAAGNDFVAVWGMPQNTGTANESIFFRRGISETDPTTLNYVGAGPTAATNLMPTNSIIAAGSTNPFSLTSLDQALASAAQTFPMSFGAPASGFARDTVSSAPLLPATASSLASDPGRAALSSKPRAASNGTEPSEKLFGESEGAFPGFFDLDLG